MNTRHRIIFSDSREFRDIQDESVELVVTSPPYPMIGMWDPLFCRLNPSVSGALASGDGQTAFELMHQELDKTWRECFRALKPGCMACINIGDAVRTTGGDFQIYSNHSRVMVSMCRAGFTPLPDILWRKQTNSPNKFMGSGMLPGGAYVTYEHEYILIFRKGGKREFKTAQEKARRRQSAFFWEERNVWFSDVWTDLKGTSQEMADRSARSRSGAFPFDLAYRLICMHSVYGDTVLDPFLGTGTTTAAAIASCRNSAGIEIDRGMLETVRQNMQRSLAAGSERIKLRVADHYLFASRREQSGAGPRHVNARYGFPVATSQERDILFYMPRDLKSLTEEEFEAHYEAAGAETRSSTGRRSLVER